jgi:hypothetical protein
MSHLALVFGFIGRLYAIHRALSYDMRKDPSAHNFEQVANPYAVIWDACWKGRRLAAWETL